MTPCVHGKEAPATSKRQERVTLPMLAYDGDPHSEVAAACLQLVPGMFYSWWAECKRGDSVTNILHSPRPPLSRQELAMPLLQAIVV